MDENGPIFTEKVFIEYKEEALSKCLFCEQFTLAYLILQHPSSIQHFDYSVVIANLCFQFTIFSYFDERGVLPKKQSTEKTHNDLVIVIIDTKTGGLKC